MKSQFIINNIKLECDEQYLSGKDLKMLAGIPLTTELYLSLQRPYEDELIENNSQIDLLRPGIEYFYVPNNFHLIIDNKKHQWHKQYISAEELRKIGLIDPEHEIFVQLNQTSSELITNDIRIDLSKRNLTQIVSRQKSNEFTFIVNGRNKQWKQELISFDQAIYLAFGKADFNQSRAYTITYSRGTEPKTEGIMVKGNEVRVKDKMIFNVTATDKS